MVLRTLARPARRPHGWSLPSNLVASPRPRGGLAPALALAATVLAAFVLLAGLARRGVPMPRILSDELRYTIAADSLASGDGLELRGEATASAPCTRRSSPRFSRSPPTGRSHIRSSRSRTRSSSRSLLCRSTSSRAGSSRPGGASASPASRSRSPPPCTCRSSSPRACPTSSAWLAILALVLALERPSVPRQLAVLGAVAVATLTRAQFAALFPAYVAALVASGSRPGATATEPSRARRALADARRARRWASRRPRGAGRERTLAEPAARRPTTSCGKATSRSRSASGSSTTSPRSSSTSRSSRSRSPRSCSSGCCRSPSVLGARGRVRRGLRHAQCCR